MLFVFIAKHPDLQTKAAPCVVTGWFLLKDYWINFPMAFTPLHEVSFCAFTAEIHISWKRSLNRCLWNGSTPLHRKTPPEREFVSQLSTTVVLHVSLGTPASHEDHHQQEQNCRCHCQDRYCCARYGWAHTSVVFVTCDIVESPQRIHHELQTTGIKVTFYDSFQKVDFLELNRIWDIMSASQSGFH